MLLGDKEGVVERMYLCEFRYMIYESMRGVWKSYLGIIMNSWHAVLIVVQQALTLFK